MAAGSNCRHGPLCRQAADFSLRWRLAPAGVSLRCCLAPAAGMGHSVGRLLTSAHGGAWPQLQAWASGSARCWPQYAVAVDHNCKHWPLGRQAACLSLRRGPAPTAGIGFLVGRPLASVCGAVWPLGRQAAGLSLPWRLTPTAGVGLRVSRDRKQTRNPCMFVPAGAQHSL